MDNKSNEKKINLTEKQESCAAEAILNPWLRVDDNDTTYRRGTPKDTNRK